MSSRVDQKQKLIDLACVGCEVACDDVACAFISEAGMLDGRMVPGLDVATTQVGTAVYVKMVVKAGIKIEKPIQLCMGVLDHAFIQELHYDITVEPGAEATAVGHCVFPAPHHIVHKMAGIIHVKKGGKFTCEEVHHHQENSDVEVYCTKTVTVDEGGTFMARSDYLQGRAGKIRARYIVDAAANSVTDILVRCRAHKDDDVIFNDVVRLNGENAKAAVRSRLAASEQSKVIVQNDVTANAAGCRGHIDCTEILQAGGRVIAEPKVQVNHDQAHITHEARLGGVDDRQVETLIARGLSRAVAENVIVEGMLRA